MDFIQKGNRWECEFEIDGKQIMQIIRTDRGGFDIYAKSNYDNLPYVSVYSEPRVGERQNLLFTLDIPVGMMVKLVSYTEIVSAYAENID